MSTRTPINIAPTKETTRQTNDIKSAATVTNLPCKTTPASIKCGVVKSVGKEMPVSPGAPANPSELLGSLTTQQQQRTSARVIKKLRLDDAAADKDKKDMQECDPTMKLKEEEKETLKLSTVKQRMPKAIWLTDEKSLFFEALNEYGKDFDAITAHICAKMKKKGVPESMLKTKNQVSHFYYRTWHKLSKHVHFDENVKKVAQELYALINYGELRKKLSSVNAKTCARLGEMVARGSLAVRARGRSLRVRTPVCRALRRLNQISERAVGARVCGRCVLVLRARTGAAWARVQAAAHNPRAAAELPLRARLKAFLAALERRWAPVLSETKLDANCIIKAERDQEDNSQDLGVRVFDEERAEAENHLNLPIDRVILQEQKLPKKLALHVGPSPKTSIHLPILTGSEHLSSQKICFTSYLERMCKDGVPPKIRTPKRQRKDSTTDKETDTKKIKMEDTEPKLDIDETAIDGIELMASIKNHQEDEEKPSTEDEKEPKLEEFVEDHDTEERDVVNCDKDVSEREKDSFSEMEDDEKFNKSDSDNESDGKRKFKNLKVKFRIRPKKRGGSIYTVITDENKDIPNEEIKSEDHMKMELDQKTIEDQIKSQEEQEKPDIDVEMVTRQIRKGWSVHDAGQLTIGDLYLMFGSRSKIELDYWWAEPTPPLPQTSYLKQKPTDNEKPPTIEKAYKILEKRDKTDKTPEKGTDSSLEDDKEKRESDTDIFSPKNAYSQDSNDGLSGDEKRNEQLMSPEHKCGTLPLASKLVNRPDPVDSSHNHLSVMTDRLKLLLALAGNPHIISSSGFPHSGGKCGCGHVCSQKKKTTERTHPPTTTVEQAQVFRHPTPIAPKPDQVHKPFNVGDLPKWRRGRPRADTRVVVQRLLPLLPKLPPANNLIPVKLVSNTAPQPPKILPKPPAPPTANSDLSHVYVLSEMNGQFFFHDGDRRIPLTPAANNLRDNSPVSPDEMEEYVAHESTAEAGPLEPATSTSGAEPVDADVKTATTDITSFLPSESLSLSPSRLLRDADGAWLDGSVQDFSLSSFLGHLEGRHRPDLVVDSQLQSLMAESSVDYVAKFADLAAEVTDEAPPPTD